MKTTLSKKHYQRYFYALLMLLAMVGIAELLEEKEIIFPEMAALTIGMWVVDKRVWRVNKSQLLILMTFGSIAGVCITLYSPFPMLANLGIAFIFSALCLLLSRTTLIPLISACMLPVLLHTESWVYPVAVFFMSVLIIKGQYLMEKSGLRQPIVYEPKSYRWKDEIYLWLLLLGTFLTIATLPVYTSNLYCILPPLIVTYTEFANSKAGFRNRPLQIFLFLVIAATIGTASQLLLYHGLGLPEILVALFTLLCLFALFERSGKFFAPAGAMALIPIIVPQKNLITLPLQVAIGAALFIGTAMLLFLKCYKWPKAQLIVCLVPSIFRTDIRKHPQKSK